MRRLVLLCLTGVVGCGGGSPPTRLGNDDPMPYPTDAGMDAGWCNTFYIYPPTDPCAVIEDGGHVNADDGGDDADAGTR